MGSQLLMLKKLEIFTKLRCGGMCGFDNGGVTKRRVTNPYTLVYQSRVRPVDWLKPHTDETSIVLGQKGVNSLLAVPISFVSEHIDVEYRDLAFKSGIKKWGRLPALGCEPPTFVSDLPDAVVEMLEKKNHLAIYKIASGWDIF